MGRKGVVLLVCIIAFLVSAYGAEAAVGDFLFKWGSYGSADGQFINPVDLALDMNGNIYVADAYNHRIQVFDNNGTLIRKWGSYGSGDGQFNYPTGITVDSDGDIYCRFS